MNIVRPTAPDSLVSSSEIARLAGVTRAAVTNWRKRHSDFPKPAGGTAVSAKFSRAEITAWLEDQRKGTHVSDEVQLWEALRESQGDAMLEGIASIAEHLSERSSHAGFDAKVAGLIERMTRDDGAAEVVDGLADRLVTSSARTGAGPYSTTRLAEAVARFAGPTGGTVLDPACGLGELLLGLCPRPGISFRGQDIEAEASRLTAARLRLSGASADAVEVRVGDSLRNDGWPNLKADLVVCEVPTGVPDWGREELLMDQRWEFGVPSRAEGELAWLQHCYAHTVEGGRTMLVMPSSVAYRKAGRRIRAELIRRGVLNEVVALPAGIAASHAQPMHLWILRRPAGQREIATVVRMTDLTANEAEGPFEPAVEQTVEIPAIELLDEAVDLTPGRYVARARTDYIGRYTETRAAIEEYLQALVGLLPVLEPDEHAQEGTTVSIGDLVKAGLVEVTEGGVVSMSDQLDTDFLNGFLGSVANTRRSTSASGTYRAEVRGARIPQMGIEEQRRYGAAFRAIEAFQGHLKALLSLGEQAAELGRDALTGGVLGPEA